MTNAWNRALWKRGPDTPNKYPVVVAGEERNTCIKLSLNNTVIQIGGYPPEAIIPEKLDKLLPLARENVLMDIAGEERFPVKDLTITKDIAGRYVVDYTRIQEGDEA